MDGIFKKPNKNQLTKLLNNRTMKNTDMSIIDGLLQSIAVG